MMDLGEVGWGDVDRIGLAQDSFHQILVNYTGLTTGGLSSSAQLQRKERES
jgi:hypothetical protein